MAASTLVELGIALSALAAVGALARRVDVSVIPAYILVGTLIGPHAPRLPVGVSTSLVTRGEVIDALAELGIVLLLFFLGLEFSLQRLFEAPRRLAAVGVLDFAVNFGLGLGIGLLVGGPPIQVVLVAGVVYISSSAVITKSLIDTGWVANPESDPILGTLVFEDVVIAVYLAIVSAILLGGGDLRGAALATGRAMLFLAVLVAVAWFATGPIERLFAERNDELFLLRVLGVVVLVAGAALVAGLSEAVAAFFVGAALSQTTHVARVETVVAPARDLFAAVFFLAIGLSTDLRLLVPIAGLLAVATLVSTVGKVASGTVAGRWYDLDARRSLRVGLGLVPRGEFSLIIAALAATAGGRVAQVVPPFAVGYVLLMSVLGTVLIQGADPITDRFGPVIERSGIVDDGRGPDIGR